LTQNTLPVERQATFTRFIFLGFIFFTPGFYDGFVTFKLWHIRPQVSMVLFKVGMGGCASRGLNVPRWIQFP
jgi:hypothetical protein|tara:strand:- start:2698 stop:2913 length:216 start_codon:yes stop_codon:yes gene_type:complete